MQTILAKRVAGEDLYLARILYVETAQLGKQVDLWSSHYTNKTTSASTSDHSTSRGSSSPSSTNTGTPTGGAAVAGFREARAQAGHGLQRRQEWRLESRRLVRAVLVEARAVPVVARPVAVEAGDGRRERERCGGPYWDLE